MENVTLAVTQITQATTILIYKAIFPPPDCHNISQLEQKEAPFTSYFDLTGTSL